MTKQVDTSSNKFDLILVRDKCIISAIEIASDLLQSNQYDARLLGLQSFHLLLFNKDSNRNNFDVSAA